MIGGEGEYGVEGLGKELGKEEGARGEEVGIFSIHKFSFIYVVCEC